MQLYHDSRDLWYRNPAGALPCGEQTRIRLRILSGEPPQAVTLRVWRDHEVRIPMACITEGGGAYRCEATLPAGQVPGLVWYRFEVDARGERFYYGNADDHLGGVGRQGAHDSYQLTVYDPAFDPPHWLREGVMYQIMVDRFYNGDPTGTLYAARADIVRHEDWNEQPFLSVMDSGDNLANDFFGGNLMGVRAKLPYLQSLGVTVLYLGPIFRARSNHKYDTGDYESIDPMFGNEADFSALCEAAAQRGIRVMLDGVFSHVGEDSRYFNRLGSYPEHGAYQSQASKYFPWFTFAQYPEEYACWWGFRTLPEVRKEEPGVTEYLLTGEQAIVKRWLRRGASAWRLDVADELPMSFLRTLREQVKAVRRDAVVLGEVWEDASNKVAYGQLRSYTLGDTLDSVMNYPLREWLIDFLLRRKTAAQCKRGMDSLWENYPRAFGYSLMNLLGSHDRARILNVLAECEGGTLPREARRELRLAPAQRALGVRRLRLMLRLMAALPGMPCIYYGDEAGLEGAEDPFCRGTYPWGREDAMLVEYFRGELIRRRASSVLMRGTCELLAPCDDVLVVIRRIDGGKDAFGEPAPDGVAVCAIHRGGEPCTVELPAALIGGHASFEGAQRNVAMAEDHSLRLTLEALEGMILTTTKMNES